MVASLNNICILNLVFYNYRQNEISYNFAYVHSLLWGLPKTMTLTLDFEYN